MDAAAAFFSARSQFRSLIRQMQGGSVIVGPMLDAFADDVYGRYGQAMALMAQLVQQGQEAGEIRDGDPAALAHLASVLTNEYALGDVAIAPSVFHALFDGAMRAPTAGGMSE